MRLKNKAAIITGGARGIGFATAKKFLQEGARVALCDIDQARVDQAVRSLAQYGEIFGDVCDVTQRSETDEFTAKVLARYGTVDILINNAGITADAQFYKMADEDFYRVVQVNLFGTYNMSKSVIKTMMEKRSGRIISASSISSIKGNFGQCNYAASKAAILSFSRSLGRELGKYGITVNCVTPGLIKTDMSAQIPPNIMQEKESSIPLKRAGEVEDVAAAYVFLASDEAAFVNATDLIVDGGMH